VLCPSTTCSLLDTTPWWWSVDHLEHLKIRHSDQTPSSQEKSSMSTTVLRWWPPSVSSSSANSLHLANGEDGPHGGRSLNFKREWWKSPSFWFVLWSSCQSSWDTRATISTPLSWRLTRKRSKSMCHKFQLRMIKFKCQDRKNSSLNLTVETSSQVKISAILGTTKVTVMPGIATGALQLTLSTLEIATPLIIQIRYQEMFILAPTMKNRSSRLLSIKMKGHLLEMFVTNSWKILLRVKDLDTMATIKTSITTSITIVLNLVGSWDSLALPQSLRPSSTTSGVWCSSSITKRIWRILKRDKKSSMSDPRSVSSSQLNLFRCNLFMSLLTITPYLLWLHPPESQRLKTMAEETV